MARSSRLLQGLALGLVVYYGSKLTGFVGTRGPAEKTLQPATSGRVSVRARGGEDYTVTDADVEKFYEETLTGTGGLPAHDSVIGSLIIKHFLGEFTAGGFSRGNVKYKGPLPS